MALDFGKLNFSTSFNPTSAFPLDARCYFESLTSAQTACKAAEEAGDSTTVYFFGQQIAVVENSVATLYIIEKKTCETSVDPRGYYGDLKEVGSKTLGDGNSIDLSDGVLSIHGFGTAGNKNVPYKDTTTGKVVWGPIEGLIPEAIVPVGDGKTILVSSDPQDENKKIVSILGSADAATDGVLRKKSDGTFEWVPVYNKTEADAITDALDTRLDTLEGPATTSGSVAEAKAAADAAQSTADNHIAKTDNPHSVTKTQVGLSNVTNDAQVKRSEMGAAGGVATLGSDGLVPSSQLPSYVDDVIEGYLHNGQFYSDSAHTQVITPEAGKIYVDLHTNKTYRWSGSQYTEISASLALGETEGTAYEGSKGKALDTRLTTAESTITSLGGRMDTAETNITELQTDIAKKANKVTSATNGHFAGLDANGDLTDSGKSANDFATAAQGAKADSAVQAVSIATGSTNGKIKLTVDGNDTEASVKGLGSAAYTDSSDYATSAQGTKADSAIQGVKVNGTALTPASNVVDVTITTGSANGKISVNGSDVAVKGLGSAAYTASTDYATAAQGTTADSAVQSLTIAGNTLSKTSDTLSTEQLKTSLGLKSAAYAETSAFDAAGAAATAKSEVIGTDDDTAASNTVKGAKKYADSLSGNYDAAGAAAAVQGATSETVKSVDDKVAILNGNASTVGSVAKAVADAKTELIGTSESASSTSTISGAKKYAEEKAAAAVAGLDATITGMGAGKTLKTLSETDGVISATFEDISITKSQVSDFEHNHDDLYYGKSSVYTKTEVDGIVDDYVPLSQKGAANGVASLDSTGKVPMGQIPDAILGQLTFGGTFDGDGIATITNGLKSKLNITDNTIQLVNSETDDKTQTPKEYGYKTLEGTYFIANATFTIGSITFEVGDWLVSIGTDWKKIDNTDAVTGVKGDAETEYRIGNVNITPANIGITDEMMAQWNAAEPNVLEAVKVNGTALDITSKAVELPLALSNKIGLVKADETSLQIDNNHVMSVKAVSTDLLTQGTNTLVLNGGDSTTA